MLLVEIKIACLCEYLKKASVWNFELQQDFVKKIYKGNKNPDISLEVQAMKWFWTSHQLKTKIPHLLCIASNPPGRSDSGIVKSIPSEVCETGAFIIFWCTEKMDSLTVSILTTFRTRNNLHINVHILTSLIECKYKSSFGCIFSVPGFVSSTDIRASFSLLLSPLCEGDFDPKSRYDGGRCEANLFFTATEIRNITNRLRKLRLVSRQSLLTGYATASNVKTTVRPTEINVKVTTRPYTDVTAKITSSLIFATQSLQNNSPYKRHYL